MCANMTQTDSAKTRVAPTIIAVIVLACIPLVWRNDYIISLLTLILLYSLMAQSWNLTIGMCSIWNLGQLAIIAIGGYVTGILTVELGTSAWLALPAGVVAGGLAAAIIVLPVIRLRGFFAALLTFAVAEVVRLLVLADGTGFTGGRFGLSGVPGLFDHLSYSGSLRAYFWLTLVLSAAVMLLVRGMMDSPFGRSMDRRRQAIVATLVSGLVAGLAGGLYASLLSRHHAELHGPRPPGPPPDHGHHRRPGDGARSDHRRLRRHHPQRAPARHRHVAAGRAGGAAPPRPRLLAGRHRRSASAELRQAPRVDERGAG